MSRRRARRRFLILAATLPIASAARPIEPMEIAYPAADPDYRMTFPRDHGAHPEFRNEWWYVTGWLKTARGEELGFQVTFFRTRPPFATDNPSAFAPRQILLAHAALADARLGRLRHDQRAARPALGVAGAAEDSTHVWIDDWRLDLQGRDYRARIAARGFVLDLEFGAEAAPLAQGVNGFSRKGLRPNEASHYYSRPGLKVRGAIERGAGRENVSGAAWLDHEWSSSYMAAEAAGWDWIGVTLEDGGALMAFRMRGRNGAAIYAGGTWLKADATRENYAPQEIEFVPLRRWRSLRSGTEYPVAIEVRTRDAVWRIEPLMEDQELDSRASTGTIYWEGAVRVSRAGKPVGKGYLELTGYWRALRL